jgi:hypothetical protein
MFRVGVGMILGFLGPSKSYFLGMVDLTVLFLFVLMGLVRNACFGMHTLSYLVLTLISTGFHYSSRCPCTTRVLLDVVSQSISTLGLLH